MAAVQLFVLDTGTGEWVPWDGGTGGGAAADVVVTSWTATESVTTTPLTLLTAANLGGLNAAYPGGGSIVARPGDWVEFSDPGAGLVATCTRLASAGKSHVITSITGSTLAVNAQGGQTLRLSDGAATIWATKFLSPTGQGRDFQLTGLNIVITPGNSVTLAWAAAPAAGNFLTCCMTGYTLA